MPDQPAAACDLFPSPSTGEGRGEGDALLRVPRRIQLRRTRGWRMPPGARSVARPGIFGNPFVPGEPLCQAGVALRGGVFWHSPVAWTVADVVWLFEQWALGKAVRDACGIPRLALPRTGQSAIPAPGWDIAALCRLHLKGLDLACWCALDAPCHADIELSLANG